MLRWAHIANPKGALHLWETFLKDFMVLHERKRLKTSSFEQLWLWYQFVHCIRAVGLLCTIGNVYKI